MNSRAETSVPTVYKFGGSSLADAQRLRRAADLVRACPSPVVVVVSAMGGITNTLVDAVADTKRGVFDRAWPDTVGRRHREAAAALGLAVGDVIDPLLAELEELLGASAVIRGATPRIRDRILATGEKLSARLLAALLARDGRGRAQAVDADTFLETNDRFGEAFPLFGVIGPSTRAALRPIVDEGSTPVVTGFCGRAPCGSTTTLGRGGSDFSATLIAAALDADEVVIWTDVPGVYSANPAVVTDARIVSQLNYREAGELSFYGAKVLHPRAIQPLIGSGIPAQVRSTFESDAPGTRIDGTVTPGTHPVKAVSAVPRQALLSIEGTGMAGVPGIAARIFGALADADISVTMISQSSAESSVCVAVPQDRAADAHVALRDAFRLDLGHGDVEDIRVQDDTALIAAIGLGMNHARGVASRLFTAVTRAGVNVMAIAQGSSELNITFTVDEDESARAIRAVHEEFGLHLLDPGEDNTAHVDLLLFGFGHIGRALSELLHERAHAIDARFGATPRVIGVADRGGYLFRATGLPVETLRHAARAKESGASVSTLDGGVPTDDARDLLREALRYRLSRPIVIDVSDGDTLRLHVEALARGADVVTANKAPLAGPVAHYRELVEASRRSGRFLRMEATVGAGLPIVDTIDHLRATGDRVRRIEGCLSGTLTFVLSRVGQGDGLQQVLAEARERGYLEPNPLVDLSGEDVLRKAIIISRVSGFEIDHARIACEGLVERSTIEPGTPPSLDAIPAMSDLEQRAEAARRAGKVLRYVATVDEDAIDVRPVPVDPQTPLGMLQGTDNIMLLHSDRYRERPLVVSGPGAGIEVTAMGVLTDVLRIVAERTAP